MGLVYYGPSIRWRRKEKKEPPKILGKSAVLAFPGRFERPACRLGGGRSILLSYGNIYSLFSIMPHSRDSAFAHLGGGRSILLSYGDRCMGLPHGMRGWGAAKGAAGADGLTKSRPALPKG